MLRLRLSEGRLLALDRHGTWWEIPAVLFGWRVAKCTHHRDLATCRVLGPRTDRALRRIVGLPGETAPEPTDWAVYSAWRPATAIAREEVLVPC